MFTHYSNTIKSYHSVAQNPITAHQKFPAPLMLSKNSLLYVSYGGYLPIGLFANSKFSRHSAGNMTMQRYKYI